MPLRPWVGSEPVQVTMTDSTLETARRERKIIRVPVAGGVRVPDGLYWIPQAFVANINDIGAGASGEFGILERDTQQYFWYTLFTGTSCFCDLGIDTRTVAPLAYIAMPQWIMKGGDVWDYTNNTGVFQFAYLVVDEIA